MNASFKMAVLAMSLSFVGLASCAPSEPNDLDALGKVTMTIEEQTFELWIADNSTEQSRGLMFVTAEQMAPKEDGTERGMIFVFDRERHMSFWMKNTIIPLDIAYVDAAGKITATHTMAPLDTRVGQYPSVSPARFAIEVNAGVWERLGVEAGDTLQIPQTVLKRAP